MQGRAFYWVIGLFTTENTENTEKSRFLRVLRNGGGEKNP
jgi:hypothetical protein